jgi:hypothetical protein
LVCNGEVVEGVQLIAVEGEPGTPPQVHIEMEPQSTNIRVGIGSVLTWLITCPNCSQNQEHICEVKAKRIFTAPPPAIPPAV